MQTDSHMDFSDDFDTELVLMHHRTENDYAVLSTYVASIEENNLHKMVVPNLCMATFTSSIRNWGTKECRNLVRPKLTNAMWGAGLSFHRCHAEINVPVDPYLDGVFDGEEGSRGIRFFTHGYDVYTPDVVLVTHDYHGHQNNPVVHTWRAGGAQKGKNVWKWKEDIDRERENIRTLGTQRVNRIIGIGSEPTSQVKLKEIEAIRASRFGLGKSRSLQQAVEFSGIDLVGRKMLANKCGNLIWVPFAESEAGDYGVGDVLLRGLAGPGESQGVKIAPANIKPAAVPKTRTLANDKRSKRDPLRLLRSNVYTDRARKESIEPGTFTYSTTSVVAAAVVLIVLLIGVISKARRVKKGDRHKN